MKPVPRTRFAPSPTGFLHAGNLWTAFLNWLWTRQHGGILLLRIEDIDRQRCRTEYARCLMEDLLSLGLDWDEGPVMQHERMDFYGQIRKQWTEAGWLYPCYCSRARLQHIASAPHTGEALPFYDGHCRSLTPAQRAGETKTPSWRFRTEEETVSFRDLLAGIQTASLVPGRDDPVLFRADGMVSYQLASSADDGAMGVTHVFRGRDLLPSAFGQISLIRRMGFSAPVYGHLPLLTDSSGVRLSKRQKGITWRELHRDGMSAGRFLGSLLWLAGALSRPESFSARRAAEEIPFEICTRLTEPHIAVGRIFN